MKPINKWFISGSLIFVSGLSGFVIAKIFTIPGIEMDTHINPLHALSILTPVFIAILVTIIFNKENEKNQHSKQLIISRVCSAYDISDDFHNKLVNRQIDYLVVVSSLKRINIICNCIYKLCGLVKYKITIEKSVFENRIKALNTLMTNTPIINTSSEREQPITIKENVITYSNDRIAEIETQIDQFKNQLLELQVELIHK